MCAQVCEYVCKCTHVCLICWAENLRKIPRLSAGGVGVLHLPFFFGKIQFSLQFLVRKVNETTSPQNLWTPDMWQGQSEQGGRPSLGRRRLCLRQPAACEARQPLAFLRHGLVSMALTVCWGPLFPLSKEPLSCVGCKAEGSSRFLFPPAGHMAGGKEKPLRQCWGPCSLWNGPPWAF